MGHGIPVSQGRYKVPVTTNRAESINAMLKLGDDKQWAQATLDAILAHLALEMRRVSEAVMFAFHGSGNFSIREEFHADLFKGYVVFLYAVQVGHRPKARSTSLFRGARLRRSQASPQGIR